MKTIAKIALQPGMELGEDIRNNQGDVVIPAHTIVDDTVLARLARLNVMAVQIMEDLDYATTHFEKIRFSESFRAFEKKYLEMFAKYKEMMNALVNYGTPADTTVLLSIYDTLTKQVGSHIRMLEYLNNMVLSEDELTHTHCLNSALIAGIFADWLSMEPNEKEIAILCAYFYDIGKLKLPAGLLWKPGKLTDVEFAQIKTHPLIGFKLVQNQTNLNPHVIKAILMHHERCDGSGYPSKLKMHQIDPYARLIAIIDAYEAMTSARAYRQSLMPLQVVERFEESGLIKYDYEILRPIISRIAESQLGLKVKLSDDSVWEIFMLNQNKLSRPVLKRNNPESNTLEFLDLQKRQDLEMQSIY